MSRALGLLLAALLGCRSFVLPVPEEVRDFCRQVPSPEGPFLRFRVRLGIESPSFSGNFEGVILAKIGDFPTVRAQFFPDLGGKALDLLARPDRITGYFPMSNEGIDIALPEEARLHLISLMGVNLLEHFSPLTEARVLGVRREKNGLWYRVSGVVPGVTLWIHSMHGTVTRQFEWKHGIEWCEVSRYDFAEVSAARMKLKVEILEKERLEKIPEALLDLKLPEGTKR